MVNERGDTKSDSNRERSTLGLDTLIDGLAFAATRVFIHNEEVLSKVSHTSVMARQLIDDVVKLKEYLEKENTMNTGLDKGGRHCGAQGGAVWVEAQGVLGSGIAEDHQHVSARAPAGENRTTIAPPTAPHAMRTQQSGMARGNTGHRNTQASNRGSGAKKTRRSPRPSRTRQDVDNEVESHLSRPMNDVTGGTEVHVANAGPEPEVSNFNCPYPGRVHDSYPTHGDPGPWCPERASSLVTDVLEESALVMATAPISDELSRSRTFVAPPSLSSVIHDQPLIVSTSKSELASFGAHLQVNNIGQQVEIAPGESNLAPPIDFSSQRPALVADTGLNRSESSSSLLTRSNSEPLTRKTSDTSLSILSPPIDSGHDNRMKPDVQGWECMRWATPHPEADSMIRRKTRTW